MAVVKAPALSLDASGNLGGLCYSRWRGLHVARSAWTGTDPETVDQLVQRGYMNTVSKAWSDVLTESERQSWRAAAAEKTRLSRIKTSYIPTGYQIFVEANMLRQRIPAVVLLRPKAFIQVDSFFDVELSWNLPIISVDISLIDVIDGTNVLYYVDVFRAGPYKNAGRHAIAGEYRSLMMWNRLIDGTDTPLTADRYYWYKVRWLWEYGVAGNWFERQVYIPL